jgi:hypothetical protein
MKDNIPMSPDLKKDNILRYYFSSNQESRDIIVLQIRNQEVLSFFKSGIRRYYLSSSQESRAIIFL